MIQANELYQQAVSFLPKLLLGIIILLFFILLSWALKKIITKQIKPLSKNPLLAVFIGKTMAFITTITGVVFFLHIIDLGGIAKHIIAGAGITTFVIGFAFKDIGENFLSGILMAFKSPFKIGDLIETDGTIGYVYELDLRVTSVKTLDGMDVFIPNSQIIKTPLYNYTIDGFLRYEINIGIDYNSDFEKAIELIKNELANFSEILQKERQPVIILDELGTNAVNIKIYYWIDTFKSKSKTYHLIIKSQVSMALIKTLNAHNIYMPANIVEVKNYNTNTLQVKN